MTITITLWHVVVALVALAGGAGTLGAVVAAGIARRHLEPLIDARIVLHEASGATASARRDATVAVVEDHLRRDDGLIRKRLDDQDDGLREILEELRRIGDQRHAETREQLARIEGLLAAHDLTPTHGSPALRSTTLPGRPPRGG